MTLLPGGYALLALSGIVYYPWAPVLTGMGLVGGAGAVGMGLMAKSECGGPVRCISASNQCCFVLITIRGVICPASCPGPELKSRVSKQGIEKSAYDRMKWIESYNESIYYDLL